MVWLERAKIREEKTTEVYSTFSTAPSFFYNYKKRNVVLYRKGTDIATFLPVAAEHFQYPSKTAQKLSNNHWAFVSGFPIPFQQCPAEEPFQAAICKNGAISVHVP